MHDVFRLAASAPVIPADTRLLPHADLGFIFGNRYIITELAAKAARFYYEGRVSQFLVSGGVKNDDGVTEAAAIYHDMRERGVPHSALLIENRSRNTEENITFGKKVVDDALGLETINTLVSFGHAKAGPRFTMSLAKNWPSALPMHVSIFPKGIDAANWKAKNGFLKEAFHDAGKLPFYGSMNYIAPVLPADVDRIVDDWLTPDYAVPLLKAS